MRYIISEQREQDWGAKHTNVANVSLCGTSRHGAQPSVARFALRFDPEKFSAQFLLVFPRYIANGFFMLDTQLLFSSFLSPTGHRSKSGLCLVAFALICYSLNRCL